MCGALARLARTQRLFCVTESMMGILADGGERSFIISAKPEAVETSDIEDAKTSDAHALPSTLTTMKSRQVRIRILYLMRLQ